MNNRDSVSLRYPEAQAVQELPEFQDSTRLERGRWFIYSGPEPDARVLGRGITEAQAWDNAAWRLSHVMRRVRIVVT